MGQMGKGREVGNLLKAGPVSCPCCPGLALLHAHWGGGMDSGTQRLNLYGPKVLGHVGPSLLLLTH